MKQLSGRNVRAVTSRTSAAVSASTAAASMSDVRHVPVSACAAARPAAMAELLRTTEMRL